MISVIIPCYNQAEYLAEAIESVLNQQYLKSDVNNRKEIIVIDDGSIDDSFKIAKEYKEIKVISQTNKGLASARNTGIMWANGQWILPLDADDVLLPNCFEKIQEKIKESFNYDIIGLSFKEFGLGDREVVLMENPTIEDFKVANRIGYCSVIKTQALMEVGGYNPKMVWGAEDYDLWFDLLKRGKKLVTIPEIVWKYRVKEKSMWTETQKHREAFMNQIKTNHPEVWATF